MNRWLPQPLLSLSLVGLWLLLNNSAAMGQIVLGALIALALPLFTVRFRPRQLCIRHPLKLMRYLLVLLCDITTANLLVARLIIGSPSRLRPAFIHLPVDLDNEFAIVVLTHTVSLTPGTVSADLSPDRRTLLIHVLDLDDEAELVARIKVRYEAPLKEIFPC